MTLDITILNILTAQTEQQQQQNKPVLTFISSLCLQLQGAELTESGTTKANECFAPIHTYRRISYV